MIQKLFSGPYKTDILNTNLPMDITSVNFTLC